MADPAPHHRQRSIRDPILVGFALGVLYWLYGWHPFQIQLWHAVDDGLYARHAEGFLEWLQGRSSKWLGAFDCFLLAKAPLYGVWLAFLHILGMPLRVGEFLLMVAGAVLFRRAVRPVRELRLWEFLVVLFLLLGNPFLPQDFRLARFGLQMALTNLCLVATVGLTLHALCDTRHRLGWSVFTGLFFALAYLNREDSVWLLLPLVVSFLLQWLASLIRCRRSQATWRTRIPAELQVACCFAAGALIPILSVCGLNKAHYGAFTTTFRRDAALTALYHRLTSLEPAGHLAYVPIARPTRLKAYALSPTFAKMKPFLEGNEGYWHAGNEHSVINGHARSEQEFFVSYFEFALLWAAEKMGAKHANAMEDIYRAIDRELAEAVRTKRIVAGTHGPGLLAAPIPGDTRRILSALWTSFSSLLAVTGGADTVPDDLQGPGSMVDRAAHLTHSYAALLPKPNIEYSIRAPGLRASRSLQRLVYPLLFLSIPALLIWRRKDVITTDLGIPTLFLWSMAIPVAALLSFCMAMAMVEVLGFKFLAGVAYNALGYSPLTVLCAFAFTSLVVFSSHARKSTPERKSMTSSAGTQ